MIHVDPDADATANGASLKKTDQENIYETVDNGGHKSIELVDIGPAKKSDSSYTFQSYDFRWIIYSVYAFILKDINHIRAAFIWSM